MIRSNHAILDKDAPMYMPIKEDEHISLYGSIATILRTLQTCEHELGSFSVHVVSAQYAATENFMCAAINLICHKASDGLYEAMTAICFEDTARHLPQDDAAQKQELILAKHLMALARREDEGAILSIFRASCSDAWYKILSDESRCQPIPQGDVIDSYAYKVDPHAGA